MRTAGGEAESCLCVAGSWGLGAVVLGHPPLARTGHTGEVPEHLASPTGGSLAGGVIYPGKQLQGGHLELAGRPGPWVPGVAGQGGAGLGLQEVLGAGAAGGGGRDCHSPVIGRLGAASVHPEMHRKRLILPNEQSKTSFQSHLWVLVQDKLSIKARVSVTLSWSCW